MRATGVRSAGVEFTQIVILADQRGGDDHGPVTSSRATIDAGVLTLLLVEPGSEGLEGRGSDGGWIDVAPLAGAFIVNIGELLEVASRGYLRATEHRVRISANERISVPYFFNPRLDARIPVLTLPPESAAQARGVSRDPSDEQIFSVYGQNAWKSRIRARPDVAAVHGYV